MPTHINASQDVALNNDTILNICVFDENPPAGAHELNDFKRVRGSMAIAEEHIKSYILPAGIKVNFAYIDAGEDCYSVQGGVLGALRFI